MASVNRVKSNRMYISQIPRNKVAPELVCPTCDFQIESMVVMKRRIQFTEKVWAQLLNSNKEELRMEDVKAISGRNDLLMHCHLCEDTCSMSQMNSHIEREHGRDHMNDCSLCSVFTKLM